ncbi:MAG: sulfur carrier protein ThiS [Nitrospiraceae bacterium]
MAQLLRELDIRPDHVVVELNLEILERPDFERRPLREGDRVEIISFIGGGSEKLND